jgi:hypothetical protein
MYPLVCLEKGSLQHSSLLVEHVNTSTISAAAKFPVPVPVSTGIGTAGLRNRVVYEFICSGEWWPSGFWGAIMRLLDRSMTYDFIFFPVFRDGGGSSALQLSARAGRLHQQVLCRLA